MSQPPDWLPEDVDLVKPSAALDLAALEPPAFHSEAFAQWCCQTTVSLLAQDSQVKNSQPHLAPGMFLGFTYSIPGLEDLPRIETGWMHAPSRVVARGNPTVFTRDGEEVDVLVVIYQTVRVHV